MHFKPTCHLLFWSLFASALVAKDASFTAEEKEKLARNAFETLDFYCGKCHGKAGSNIDKMRIDREWMLDKRVVILGKPDCSLLYTTIAEENMPEPEELIKLGVNRFPKESLELIKSWIAAGAPDWDASTHLKKDTITHEAMLKWMLDDLMAQPEKERPFTRYFTLGHLFNAGESTSAMGNYRTALSKLVNSLSWRNRIINPTPIDPNKTVLRIHLKDYFWDEDIWDKIILKQHYPYPYIVDHPYPQHEQLIEATLSPVPFIRADWFIANGAKPELYHAILNLPDSDLKLEKRLNLTPTVAKNIQGGAGSSYHRSGFLQSGVSKFNRIVERHESPFGSYWKSYDFSSNKEEQNIFRSPLGPREHYPNGTDKPSVTLFQKGFQQAGGEIIFSLPNGLQGYFLVDKKGQRIDRAPIEIVQNLSGGAGDDPQISNGLSCMTCHTRGMRAFDDRAGHLRLVVEQADAAKVVRNYEKKDALNIYSEAEDINKKVDEDAQRFLEAVEETGGVVGNREPIALLANHYERALDLKLAAGELGLSVNELTNAIGRSSVLQEYGLHALLVPDGPGFARESWENNFKHIYEFASNSFDENIEEIDFPLSLETISNPRKLAFRSNVTSNMLGLGWSPDGKTLLSSGYIVKKIFLGQKNFAALDSASLLKWDAQKWHPRFDEERVKFDQQSREIIKIAFNPSDENKTATLGRVWNAQNKAFGRTVIEIFDLRNFSREPFVIDPKIGESFITDFAWSPDGRKIALMIEDQVCVYNASTGELHANRKFNAKSGFRPLSGRNWLVTPSLDWSPDGTMLVILGFKDGHSKAGAYGGSIWTCQVWDADLRGLGKNIGKPIAVFEQQALSVDWGPKNLKKIGGKFDSKIAFGVEDGRSLVFHVGVVEGRFQSQPDSNNEILIKKNKRWVINGWGNLVAWSRDGRRLASGPMNRKRRLGDLMSPGKEPGCRISIWDSENLEKELQVIEIKAEKPVEVTSFAWGPKASKIAIGLNDGTIRVFDKIK